MRLISDEKAKDMIKNHRSDFTTEYDYRTARACINAVPSTQPEIIRCKDCKYRDEKWRRVSVRWLPCMDVRTGSNWYCGSAEKGEQDE